MSPLFLAIEGIDGSGTSTQAALLADALRARGRTVLLTAEPSQGEIGQLIRRLAAPGTTLPAKTMALLFVADRMDHLDREILPALARGEDVVCCRYKASSVAYQGETITLLGSNWVSEINRFAREPDVTILLDVPIDVAATRRAARGRPVESYEDVETQKRVSAQYLRIARCGDAVLIDGNRPEGEVAADILAIVVRNTHRG